MRRTAIGRSSASARTSAPGARSGQASSRSRLPPVATMRVFGVRPSGTRSTLVSKCSNNSGQARASSSPPKIHTSPPASRKRSIAPSSLGANETRGRTITSARPPMARQSASPASAASGRRPLRMNAFCSPRIECSPLRSVSKALPCAASNHTTSLVRTESSLRGAIRTPAPSSAPAMSPTPVAESLLPREAVQLPTSTAAPPSAAVMASRRARELGPPASAAQRSSSARCDRGTTASWNDEVSPQTSTRPRPRRASAASTRPPRRSPGSQVAFPSSAPSTFALSPASENPRVPRSSGLAPAARSREQPTRHPRSASELSTGPSGSTIARVPPLQLQPGSKGIAESKRNAMP